MRRERAGTRCVAVALEPLARDCGRRLHQAHGRSLGSGDIDPYHLSGGATSNLRAAGEGIERDDDQPLPKGELLDAAPDQFGRARTRDDRGRRPEEKDRDWLGR